MWAEMLDDRKFYFPIVSNDPDPGTSAGQPDAHAASQVASCGPDEAVVMDKIDRSSAITAPLELDPSTPPWDPAVRTVAGNGKQYTGRIYLRGTPGAK